MSLDNVRPQSSTETTSSYAASWLVRADGSIRETVSSMRSRRILFTLFVIAFLLRAVYAAVAVQVDPMLNGDPLMGDAASYDRIARSLAAGTGFGEVPNEPSAFWPPLYPAFLAGIYNIFGHELMISRMVNAVLGALVPVVIYLIGVRLFDRRVALLAALGSVAYPLLIVIGAWAVPDGPYILAVCLILLTMLEIQSRPRLLSYVVLGVLLGLAFLLKPVTAFFFPFLVFWFLLSLPQIPMRQRWIAGILTAVVLLLVLAPWTVRNYVVLGSPIVGSANGGYTFYGANNPDAFGGHYEHFPARIPELSEGAEQREFYRAGIEWIISDPRAFLSVEVQKFKRLASPLSISSSPEDLSIPGEQIVRFAYTAFLILALSGIVILRRNWQTTGLLLIPLLAVLLSTAVFYGDARYTMPAVPVLVLWAAVAIVTGWDSILARVSPSAEKGQGSGIASES